MQPKMKTYRVTCLSCKDSSKIQVINDMQVVYIDHTPIIACRLRGDMKWGFECMCGNDSRLAASEKEDVAILVQGGEHALERLVASLKVKDVLKFKMESI